MKRVGCNGQFRHRTLQAEDMKCVRCAEHRQPVQGVHPELVIIGQSTEG
jgi:hypothetical protein